MSTLAAVDIERLQRHVPGRARQSLDRITAATDFPALVRTQGRTMHLAGVNDRRIIIQAAEQAKIDTVTFDSIGAGTIGVRRGGRPCQGQAAGAAGIDRVGVGTRVDDGIRIVSGRGDPGR